MLSMIETAPEVFDLTETLMGFDEDNVTHWYWDMNRNLLSEKSDFPQPSMYTRALGEADKVRFERFYRPLLKPAV